LTEPLLDPGLDEPRSVTDERNALRAVVRS
jgi:hypothetical protein